MLIEPGSGISEKVELLLEAHRAMHADTHALVPPEVMRNESFRAYADHMGTPAFREAILALVRTHATVLSEGGMTEQLSREGRYLSLTITVRAESRAQLETTYAALSARSEVLMVL